MSEKKEILIIGNDTYSADLLSSLGNPVIIDHYLLLDTKKRSNIIESIEEKTKAVLFTGGADVDPKLYGDTTRGMCGYNKLRDELDVMIYQLCKNIPKIGICRGHQFLNVMNGGKLMHHVTKHSTRGKHGMRTIDNEYIMVNSLHHQLLKVTEDTKVIGELFPKEKGEVYYGNKDLQEAYNGPDVEAAWFKRINAFSVQYHPEFMHEEDPARLWFIEKVSKFINGDFDKLYNEGNEKYVSKF